MPVQRAKRYRVEGGHTAEGWRVRRLVRQRGLLREVLVCGFVGGVATGLIYALGAVL